MKAPRPRLATVPSLLAMALLGLAVVLLAGCQPLQGTEQTLLGAEQLQPATSTSAAASTSTAASQAESTTTTAGPSESTTTSATTTTTHPKPTPAQPLQTTTSLMLSVITMLTLPSDTWVRYEETDSNIAWVGEWLTYSIPQASGGSFRAASTKAAYRVWIQGTAIQLAFMLGPDAGIAKLTLDDAYVYTVDLYASVAQSSVLWHTPALPFGSHTLLVEWTGTSNSASIGSWIDLDAVEVKGTLVK